MSFAFGLSAFALPVLKVIVVRAKEKMLWVYARRIVASVQNLHTVRDGTPKQLVSGAMGLRDQLPHLEMTVSLAVPRALPSPAFISVSEENSFAETARLGAMKLLAFADVEIRTARGALSRRWFSHQNPLP
jgi:hypothetical protein